MDTFLLHSFAQPLPVTATLSVVFPAAPAVKLIDWAFLGEVISPLVMDQA
jgi:hypothetical protein